MPYDPLTLWPNVLESVVLGGSIIVGAYILARSIRVLAQAIQGQTTWKQPIE